MAKSADGDTDVELDSIGSDLDAQLSAEDLSLMNLKLKAIELEHKRESEQLAMLLSPVPGSLATAPTACATAPSSRAAASPVGTGDVGPQARPATAGLLLQELEPVERPRPGRRALEGIGTPSESSVSFDWKQVLSDAEPSGVKAREEDTIPSQQGSAAAFAAPPSTASCATQPSSHAPSATCASSTSTVSPGSHAKPVASTKVHEPPSDTGLPSASCRSQATAKSDVPLSFQQELQALKQCFDGQLCQAEATWTQKLLHSNAVQQKALSQLESRLCSSIADHTDLHQEVEVMAAKLEGVVDKVRCSRVQMHTGQAGANPAGSEKASDFVAANNSDFGRLRSALMELQRPSDLDTSCQSAALEALKERLVQLEAHVDKLTAEGGSFSVTMKRIAASADKDDAGGILQQLAARAIDFDLLDRRVRELQRRVDESKVNEKPGRKGELEEEERRHHQNQLIELERWKATDQMRAEEMHQSIHKEKKVDSVMTCCQAILTSQNTLSHRMENVEAEMLEHETERYAQVAPLEAKVTELSNLVDRLALRCHLEPSWNEQFGSLSGGFQRLQQHMERFERQCTLMSGELKEELDAQLDARFAEVVRYLRSMTDAVGQMENMK